MPDRHNSQAGTNVLKMNPQNIYTESETQMLRLGSMLQLGLRRYAYCKAGAVALTAGTGLQASAPVANHLNCTVSAAVAAGVKVVTPTMGATAVTANQYAEGFLHCNDVSPEGETYLVKSNPAALSGATCAFTLYDGIATAMTTSSQVTLTANPLNAVLIAPNGALTAPFVGVAPIDVTASYFFWLQVGGPAAVLTQGTVVIGQPVGLGGTADGACGPVAADTTDIWGVVMQVNASTEYSLINLYPKF